MVELQISIDTYIFVISRLNAISTNNGFQLGVRKKGTLDVNISFLSSFLSNYKNQFLY